MNELPDSAYYALTEGRISRGAFQLHRALQKFVNKGRVCFPSNRRLRAEMAAVGMIVRDDGTLRRLKRQLVKAGFLVVNQVYTRIGRQTSNFYRLTEPKRPGRAAPKQPAEALKSPAGAGPGRRIPGRKDGARRFAGYCPGEEGSNALLSYELTGTEKRTSPSYSPGGGNVDDPETAPARNGIDPGPSRQSDNLTAVMRGFQRINGGKEIGVLPTSVLRTLERIADFYGVAGVIAGYQLWHQPDKPWSMWATKTKHRVGALLHEFIWPKVVDDPAWPGLKRKCQSDLDRESGFDLSHIGRFFGGMGRAGP